MKKIEVVVESCGECPYCDFDIMCCGMNADVHLTYKNVREVHPDCPLPDVDNLASQT